MVLVGEVREKLRRGGGPGHARATEPSVAPHATSSQAALDTVKGHVDLKHFQTPQASLSIVIENDG